MTDPQTARAALKRYYAETPTEKLVDDVRRSSPELAERLGVAEWQMRARSRRGVRGFFASFGRSVHRLFS